MAGQGTGPLQLHPLPCPCLPRSGGSSRLQKALGVGLPTKAVFDQWDMEAHGLLHLQANPPHLQEEPSVGCVELDRCLGLTGQTFL